jgi:hypothetical protein
VKGLETQVRTTLKKKHVFSIQVWRFDQPKSGDFKQQKSPSTAGFRVRTLRRDFWSTNAKLHIFRHSDITWPLLTITTWGTPGTPFFVQIHKSCLFIVFDGFHVQDRKFTPFPIAERFFTSFWLNCVQITFTLRSNCVQITFNYVQVAQKLRTMSSFESALWKAVPDNNSCPTVQ